MPLRTSSRDRSASPGPRQSRGYSRRTHRDRSKSRDHSSSPSPHSHRRSRSSIRPGGSTGSSEGGYEEGTTRQKGVQDPLSRPGRHFTRTVHMWYRFEPIINAGTVPVPVIDEANPPAVIPPPPNPVLTQFYRQLIQIEPTLPAALSTRTIAKVTDVLEVARTNARGEDVKRIKDNVNLLRPFDPPLKTSKETRGFHHFQCGRLLVPALRVGDWDNDAEYRSKLKQQEELINPRDYPLLLYPDDFVDEDNLLEGFGRNNLLVRGWRMIFQGVSSIDGKGPSSRATKKGNAQLNGMKKVTVPSIAYIAVLVRHALSSQQTFGPGGSHGEFDNHAFYTSIIDLLMDPRMTKLKTELLAWWDKQIFGEDRERDMTQDEDTLYAKMFKQVEAAAAA